MLWVLNQSDGDHHCSSIRGEIRPLVRCSYGRRLDRLAGGGLLAERGACEVTSLRSRTCVVSGATGGIGEAIVAALVSEGAHVWAIGRDQRRLDELASSIAGRYRHPRSSSTSSPSSEIRACRRDDLAESGSVDVLVHSAGAIRSDRVASSSAEDLDQLYAVNLRAPFVLTRQLLPALRASGQIVFVNSTPRSDRRSQFPLRVHEGGSEGAGRRTPRGGQSRRSPRPQRLRRVGPQRRCRRPCTNSKEGPTGRSC